MPYDDLLVSPMREELSQAGVQELRTPQAVDDFMKQQEGTALLVVNSVCGCAAGSARPGVRMALQGAKKPQKCATVFAGQDVEATAKARSYFSELPPSSPSFILFKDGKPVHYTPRHSIEAKSPQAVAQELSAVFNKYC